MNGDLDAITGWSAIVSTAAVNARTNTGTTDSVGVPIFLLGTDTIVADTYADLWDGTIDIVIQTNQTITKNDQVSVVWSGTLSDGTTSTKPLGSALVLFGNNDFTDFQWINQQAFINEQIFVLPNNTEDVSLYALSDVLLVPTIPTTGGDNGQSETLIPEPTTLLLFGVGLLGLAGIRRRRQIQ